MICNEYKHILSYDIYIKNKKITSIILFNKLKLLVFMVNGKNTLGESKKISIYKRR